MPVSFNGYIQQFFWNFKRMDNVLYNFEIIELLYKAKKQNENNLKFNKPIIVLFVAIIECMLYDFTARMRGFHNDPFPNITDSEVSYFRLSKDTDELKLILPRLQAQNLLRATSEDSIYSDLEHLRNVRNRLHIQNKYNMLERDESDVYTDANLKMAECCFEKVTGILCNVYPRWRKDPLDMADFPRPWQDV